MGQPTPSDVHIDAALTDMSIAYMQSDTAHVASRVFAGKPVQHKTDKYHIFTKSDFFRDDAVKKRATGQGAPRSGFTLSNDNYDADAWWTAVPLSELTRANSDPAVPLDVAAMRLVTQRMMIRRERLFVTNYFGTGIWATDVVGATNFTQWDDVSSDPEADIAAGKRAILVNTGMKPNCLIVGYDVHIKLKQHPMVKDRFKYTSSESITEEMLARFFEIEKYVVAEAVYDTAAEGATDSFDFIIGKHALLCFDNPAPSVMEPSAGVNFVWSGLTGMNDLGVRIDQYYDDDTKEDVVRGEFAFDMKVTGTDLGYFFSAAVA